MSLSTIRYTAFGVKVLEAYVSDHKFHICLRCGVCHFHEPTTANAAGLTLGLPKNHKPVFCGKPKDLNYSFPAIVYGPYIHCPYVHYGSHPLFKSKSGLTQHVNYAHGGWSSEPVEYKSSPTSASQRHEVTIPEIDLTEHGYDAELASKLDSVMMIERLSGAISKELFSVLGSKGIVQTLSNIYIGIDLALDSPRMQAKVDEQIATTMTHILNYLVMSSAGEARHFKYRTSLDALPAIARLSPFAQWLAGAMPGGASRTSVWMLGLELSHLVGVHTVLGALREIFSLSEVWGEDSKTGFGGPKWAQVCAHALKLIDGFESPIMALDSIIDIVHNGGWALNKYYYNDHGPKEGNCRHVLSLASALDIKQRDAKELLSRVCIDPWLKEAILNEEGLIYRLYKHNPAPSGAQFFTESEIAVRMGLSVPSAQESARFAHLECAEGFWPATLQGLQIWAKAFGKGEQTSVSEKQYGVWNKLLSERSAPPRYAEFEQWVNAIPNGRKGWDYRGYSWSLWQRKLVEAIDAGLTPKEAKKRWQAEISAPEPAPTEPQSVVFRNKPTPSNSSDVVAHVPYNTAGTTTGTVWLEDPTDTERVAISV